MRTAIVRGQKYWIIPCQGFAQPLICNAQIQLKFYTNVSLYKTGMYSKVQNYLCIAKLQAANNLNMDMAQYSYPPLYIKFQNQKKRVQENSHGLLLLGLTNLHPERFDFFPQFPDDSGIRILVHNSVVDDLLRSEIAMFQAKNTRR